MKKLINQLLGWKYGESPKDGNLYWVRLVPTSGCDPACTFEATATGYSCGWISGDWEDRRGEVIAYKKCPTPKFYE